MGRQPIVGKLPLERYRAAMEEFPIVTVDVVFLNADKTKILLGKRVNEPFAGVFYSFGGRLHKNEDLQDATSRIAREEVGISLSPADSIFAGVLNEINDTSIFPGVNYQAITLYFGCTITEDAFSLDSQHSDVQWFPIDDPSLHPNVKARIGGVLKVLT